jgi:site-specific DNA-methyltransferase (adenine-specific)
LPPTVEHVTNELQSVEYGDSGGASRFFYVAKAPARERPKVDGTAHPTVKPLTLMRWLCRLVTAPNGVILEPFAGSGTTVEAALLEGFRVIAIEREADYLPLIQARLDRVAATEPTDEQLTLDASA